MSAKRSLKTMGLSTFVVFIPDIFKLRHWSSHGNICIICRLELIFFTFYKAEVLDVFCACAANFF